MLHGRVQRATRSPNWTLPRPNVTRSGRISYLFGVPGIFPPASEPLLRTPGRGDPDGFGPAEPDAQTRRQLTSPVLAALLAGLWTVLGGAVGVTLLLAGSGDSANKPAGHSTQLPAARSSSAGAASAGASTGPNATASSTGAKVVVVNGPRGLVTAIPAGWAPKPLGSGENVQATDPADAGRFVRFGAMAAPKGDLLAQHARTEKNNSNIRDGYQRITLKSTTFHGAPAVEWEFEFTKDGQRRHVHALYWRTGGSEFTLYASATAAGWSSMAPVFASMQSNAKP